MVIIFRYKNKVIKFTPQPHIDTNKFIADLPSDVPYKIIEGTGEGLTSAEYDELLDSPDGYGGNNY